MPPRPILKGLPSSNPSFVSSEATSNPLPFSSCSRVLDTPHVHFPPTPTLTSTEVTHSSFTYDRAPIIVAPNTCALPERGGRKLTGTNSNKGGLGYFHPHAMFQVDAVRAVERDSSETVSSPTIFSASMTLTNDCGSVGLFMKKRSGPLHEYEYDQPPNHDQHTSSDSSDLGVFCSPPMPPAPYVPTSSLSSNFSPSSSIPHSSVNLSTWHVYTNNNNTPTATPPSPGSTANYKDCNIDDNDSSYPNQFISRTTHIGVYSSTSKLIPPCHMPPPSSSNGSPVKPQDNKMDSVDADGKKRRKSNKGYTPNTRVEGESRTRIGTQYNTTTTSRREFELGGCLGGF